MTLKMADSIYAANLPEGFDAYLGYRDGSWPDFAAEVKRFPGKHVIGIAVTAADDGDGLDVEFRDATPDQAPGWARRQHARGEAKPIIYASISVMKAVVYLLHVNGVARSSVRLVSAHYGWGRHICGPHTCAYQGAQTPQMDGTQWTDHGAGLNGSQIDESELADNFFGVTPTPAPSPAPVPTPTPAPSGVPAWQEDVLKALPVVKPGEKSNAVRTVQGLCVARGHHLGTTGPSHDGVDADFGSLTETAVRDEQVKAGFTGADVDGVVGPKTWPVLLGI